ncbi:MAG: hypothetical protein ACKOYH_09840, partial [Cyanobium sp.]
IAAAKGDAARWLEQGAAQADGLQHLVASWQQAGPQARTLYLTQRLQPLLAQLRGAVPPLNVEELRLIGEDPAQAPSLATLLAQVKAATGFDPARWLGANDTPPSDPPANRYDQYRLRS